MYLHVLRSIPKATVTKSVLGFVAAGGASIIAKEIIANNIDEPDTLIRKIKIVGGTVVIGVMVKKAVKDFIDDEIDEITDNVAKLKEEIRKHQVAEQPTE